MKNIKALILTLSMIGFVFTIGCRENSLVSTDQDAPVLQAKQKVDISNFNYPKWDLEKMEKQSATLAKYGTTQSMINDKKGGTVGNHKTLNNSVEIPKGALYDSKTKISVTVVNIENKTQTAPGVDFKPSMKFEKDVTVTLSWSFLDLADELKKDEGLKLAAFYSEDDGKTWYNLSNLKIDYDKQTLSVNTNHFTRYAWATFSSGSTPVVNEEYDFIDLAYMLF